MNNLPDNLLTYVRAQYQAGMDSIAITEQLKANKWKDSDIASAIGIVKAETHPAVPSQPVIANTLATTANSPLQAQAGNSQTNETSEPETLFVKIFRIGFASIFLVNGLVALLKPEDFEKLLLTFPLAEAIGHIDIMIMLASINDLVLSGLILSGKYKKFVWAWAGSWLAMVSLIKFITLF